MYQRFAMARASAANAEHEPDDEADHAVRQEEEDTGDDDHDEHHDRGNQRLLARRPGDLGHFGPHLLQKFKWIGSRHQPL